MGSIAARIEIRFDLPTQIVANIEIVEVRVSCSVDDIEYIPYRCNYDAQLVVAFIYTSYLQQAAIAINRQRWVQIAVSGSGSG